MPNTATLVSYASCELRRMDLAHSKSRATRFEQKQGLIDIR